VPALVARLIKQILVLWLPASHGTHPAFTPGILAEHSGRRWLGTAELMQLRHPDARHRNIGERADGANYSTWVLTIR
jgi:hypothetical protein